MLPLAQWSLGPTMHRVRMEANSQLRGINPLFGEAKKSVKPVRTFAVVIGPSKPSVNRSPSD